MRKYRVHSESDCSEEILTIQEAIKVYEKYKDNIMANGVVIGESYVEIAVSEDDFEDYTVIEKVIAVVDEIRMKISTPRDEGYDWDYWARWKNV